MKRLATTASKEYRTESHKTNSNRVRVYATRLHRFGSFYWGPHHVPEGLNLWQVSTYHNYGQCCVINLIVSILVVRSNLYIKLYHPTTSLSRNLFVMQGNSWNCTTKYTKWTRCCTGEKWFLLFNCFSQRKAGKVYIFISEGNNILWFLKHVSKYLEICDKTTYRAHVCKFSSTDGLNRKLQIPFCHLNIMLRPSGLPGVINTIVQYPKFNKNLTSIGLYF